MEAESLLFKEVVHQQAVLKAMNVKAQVVETVSDVVTATFAIVAVSIIRPQVIQTHFVISTVNFSVLCCFYFIEMIFMYVHALDSSN